MTQSTPPVTEQIARYVTEVDVAAGPAELRERALGALVDTVGGHHRSAKRSRLCRPPGSDE